MINADHVVGAIVGVSGTWVAQDLVERLVAYRRERRNVGALVAYHRGRLTPDGARELGLSVLHLPTPWSTTGDTYGLAPTPNAPCQVCWHRHDEHADPALDGPCFVSTCLCSGWDGYLDA